MSELYGAVCTESQVLSDIPIDLKERERRGRSAEGRETGSERWRERETGSERWRERRGWSTGERERRVGALERERERQGWSAGDSLVFHQKMEKGDVEE